MDLTNFSKQPLVLFKRTTFLSTYHPHQAWSLPESSIIFYIAKKCSSSTKVYEKLIKSCKYFLIKNPPLIIPRLLLEYENDEWNARKYGKCFDFKNVSKPIFADLLSVKTTSVQPFPSYILPFIFQCQNLLFSMVNISFNDLKVLASKCVGISFFKVTVLDEHGSVVPLENIVALFSRVKKFF